MVLLVVNEYKIFRGYLEHTSEFERKHAALAYLWCVFFPSVDRRRVNLRNAVGRAGGQAVRAGEDLLKSFERTSFASSALTRQQPSMRAQDGEKKVERRRLDLHRSYRTYLHADTYVVVLETI